MKKAIIIARVSDPRQEHDGLSLKDIQLPMLLQYAQDYKFEVVEKFVFQETADRKVRKIFNKIIEYVKKNKDIKSIISYRVDRVTRNYRDAVLFDDLRLEYDKELHFVYDRLVLDKNSVGRDITDWDTKVYLAKQFINRLKEDATITHRKKAENGEIAGQVCYGYRNIRENNKGSVVSDSFEKIIVKKIFELYISGQYSYKKIANTLNNDLNTKLTLSKVETIIKQPFYCGLRHYKGTLVPHIYETFITKEDWDKAQEIRLGKSKQNKKFIGRFYLYRGLITCADCGCAITPEPPKKEKYHYYHCTQYKGKHNAVWLKEDEITKQFESMFKSIKLNDNALSYLQQSLKESHSDKANFSNNLLSHLQSEYTKYQNRIEKMYEDQLDGSITKDFYTKKYNESREAQEQIQTKINNLKKVDDDYYITASYLVELASRAFDVFKSSEPEIKREMLQLVLQNCTLKGRKLDYSLQKPFDSILNLNNSLNWLPESDSN